MRTCPVCSTSFPNFLPLPTHYFEVANQLGARYSLDDYETLNIGQYSCPACGASDRDRLYALYIKYFLIKLTTGQLKVLEIAPAQGLSKFIRAIPLVQYRSADLCSPLADDKVDIMDMHIYRDMSFDFIICSHVLEHVRDDGAAMREIFRVLAHRGKAIIMVPIVKNLDRIDEDADELDPKKRIIRFGQDDHIRQYSSREFTTRLEHQGFSVQKLDLYSFEDISAHGKSVFKVHGINEGSVLYIVNRGPTKMVTQYEFDLTKATPEFDRPPIVNEMTPSTMASKDGHKLKFKVTVAIPAYKASFLDAALRSAIEQDFDDFEILICDDCRDNSVAQVVQPHLSLQGGPPIRYFYNNIQLGEASNCGKCVDLARGEYIKFLYDDDLLLPGNLSAQAAILDAQSEVSLVTSRRRLIDENGLPLADTIATLSPFGTDVCIFGHDLVSFLAEYTLNFIGEPTCVMARRTQLLLCGPDLMSLAGVPIEWVGDLTIYTKLLRLGHIAMLNEVGACFRLSESQFSHQGRLKPGIGNESHLNFKRLLGELGWLRPADNRWVRVAPLETSSTFEQIDLLARLMTMGQEVESAQRLNTNSLLTQSHWVQDARISQAHPLFSNYRRCTSASFVSVAISTCDNKSELLKTIASVQSQLQSASRIWEVTPESPMQTIKEDGGSSWTLLLCEGDVLEQDALLLLERAITAGDMTTTLVAYFDHVEVTPAGQVNSPNLKPDFNHELLLSYPYMGRALAVRSSWLQTKWEKANGAFDISFAYYIALQALKEAGPSAFIHLPAVGAQLTSAKPVVFANNSHDWLSLAEILRNHLQQVAPAAQCIEGPAPGTFHVVYPLERTPLVSIVIPTRDQLPFLSRCVESLLDKTSYPNFEILIVDNDSQTSEACNFLNGLSAMNSEQIQVLRAPGPFNFSRMNNLAVSKARGEFILMLNNDTASIQADWLGHMVRHALCNGVGIVGARLVYPDGRLQHAGVITGLRGPAEHPYDCLDSSEPGYLYRAQVTQNFSAVTAACLLVSKTVYQDVGGLDETTFGVSYNDVDFCLRVGQTGRRIVWTPLATLLHEGSATQKSGTQNFQRFHKEQASMYTRWQKQIANDPAYNPNLSLAEGSYEIETNPLLRFDKLKGLTPHRVVAFAADATGCGHYRVLQPMQAMIDEGLCTGGASPEMMGPNLVLRSGADTLIFQRPHLDSDLELLNSLLPLKGIKKIYELDDNITRVPIKSAHHGQFSKDIRGRISKAIGLCDRLVVSTEPLAHELRGKNDDIRVVHNRLAIKMWGDNPPIRQRLDRPKGIKPRVAWAGGIGHSGDLEMIGDVIKELSNQIDWIFFGMCPDSLKPFVHEFHVGVSTLDYPSKLMALSQTWDLAIAPLEINSFNECKSNLKLLEYGWCGVPVVCSDITPYQGDLPCKRVKNRFADWRSAILSMTSDLEACSHQGLQLQQAVEASWMLKGENLQAWYEAWTD